MTDWVRQVLERYGQDVTVDTADGERTVRAFLQPMTERDERARSDVTSIGWVDGRLWLYLGQTALEEGEALAWEATRFRVRSCRPYYIGNALSHYWAALEQEREAAEVLLERLPAGIRPGELNWEALTWERETGLFLRRGRLRCRAYFLARAEEGDTVFLDFRLKGAVTT